MARALGEPKAIPYFIIVHLYATMLISLLQVLQVLWNPTAGKLAATGKADTATADRSTFECYIQPCKFKQTLRLLGGDPISRIPAVSVTKCH